MVSLLIVGFLSSGLLLRELTLVVSGTEQNSREIVAFNMSFSSLATMCAALFGIYFLDASAVLLGLGLGYFIPLLIALRLQLKRYGFSMPSLADFRVIVRFGGPNMVVTSSSTAIPFVASYLTMVMIGLSDVATLAIALTISGLVSLVIGPPFTAYQSYLVKTYENNQFESAEKVTGRLFELFTSFVTFAVWGLFVFSSILISFISTPDYLSASSLVPFTATATTIIMVSYFWKLRLDLVEKTMYTGGIHVVGIVSFIILCPLFVSYLGLIGVGLALLCHSIVIAILLAYAGNMFLPIQIKRKFIFSWILATSLMIASYYALEGLSLSYPISSIISLLVFLIISFSSGMVRFEDLKQILFMFLRNNRNVN